MKIISTMEKLLLFEKYGWTEEIVRSCLAEGDVVRAFSIHTGDHCWRLAHRSSFSPERLSEFATQITRWGIPGEYVPHLEWKFWIETYNWMSI